MLMDNITRIKQQKISHLLLLEKPLIYALCSEDCQWCYQMKPPGSPNEEFLLFSIVKMMPRKPQWGLAGIFCYDIINSPYCRNMKHSIPFSQTWY